jgi:hypothetical protein
VVDRYWRNVDDFADSLGRDDDFDLRSVPVLREARGIIVAEEDLSNNLGSIKASMPSMDADRC